jgi:lipopolysaccharide export system protein LptA
MIVPSRAFGILLCVLFLTGLLSAQGQKVIILEHADSLVGRVIDSQTARELIGNVRFSQENVHVTCDRALQYIESGEVVLTGRVTVVEDSLTMRSARGVYHRDDRRAEAFEGVSLDDGTVQLTAAYGEYWVDPRQAFFRNRVVVQDTASTIVADSLLYFRDQQRSIAMGRVVVQNRADNVTITGHRLEHLSPTRFSRMTENPVLVKLERTEAGRVDTLVVWSLIMESYRDSVERLVATDSVRFVRSDIAGTAGNVLFFTQHDSLLLRRNPLLWYRNTQVSGDSINIYLARRKLSMISVMGSALAISRSDSLFPDRYDQLAGESMRLYFADQGLATIDVQTRARSVYYVYEDSAANGLNTSSGDRVRIAFTKGRVKTVTVIGGVEGEYVPENLVHNRHREYALPGFFWREDRPHITVADLPDRLTTLIRHD